MYTGYKKLILTDEQLNIIYNSGENATDETFYQNEYLIAMKDGDDKPVDYFRMDNGKFKKVVFPKLGNNFTGIMKPRNPEQHCAMDMLKSKDISIKLITGRFGCGKSMMVITAALEAVQKGLFDKIIFVRNNVQVKDTDQLGALPGEIFSKSLPYLMPFADHCGGQYGLQQLIDSNKLEVIPLGFLRGRSIKNAILYSMESENLTKEHIQLIMGRIDEGSQLWMDGDIKQRDRSAFEKSKGLEVMIDRLKGEDLFGYINLVKSERSAVAALADRLD